MTGFELVAGMLEKANERSLDNKEVKPYKIFLDRPVYVLVDGVACMVKEVVIRDDYFTIKTY